MEQETRSCTIQCAMMGKDGKPEEFTVTREVDELDHQNFGKVLRDAGIIS